VLLNSVQYTILAGSLQIISGDGCGPAPAILTRPKVIAVETKATEYNLHLLIIRFNSFSDITEYEKNVTVFSNDAYPSIYFLVE
jgi:hypothetical protein